MDGYGLYSGSDGDDLQAACAEAAAPICDQHVFTGTLINVQLIWDMATCTNHHGASMTVTDSSGRLHALQARYHGATPTASGRYFYDGAARLRGVLVGNELTVTEVL